ncbi:TPA: galactosamine-6-phosphate isomerase [Escherichia coli]|nr:galactosamine-6-phosphate isomerase [Escherichia coli O55:H7 str. 3256-97]EFX29298.1 galactosamine-6-phosphate isomerase [Escherichia coli O55:H7 str. USDA 5905]EHV22010.1 putative galactosamine-6-phosphate isomerase [Escherichia coli DEC5A]EHV36146.1 putative galactosamine-6-phosphate isomerase [Escherichia coli DEC5D]HAH2730127.1 galactosamine-6-phosphate isomerase [Escherichia coli]
MERGTASGGASLLKEFHPVQTLQQVENYTALSERASEYLLAVIRSKPDAGDLPGDRSHAITDVSLSGRKNPLAAG